MWGYQVYIIWLGIFFLLVPKWKEDNYCANIPDCSVAIDYGPYCDCYGAVSLEEYHEENEIQLYVRSLKFIFRVTSWF
jgi:hypothetical protein